MVGSLGCLFGMLGGWSVHSSLFGVSKMSEEYFKSEMINFKIEIEKQLLGKRILKTQRT